MWFYGIYLKLERQVFLSYKSQPKHTGGRPADRLDQWSVNRHGRPICMGRAQRPAHLAGRSCGRQIESTLLSGEVGRPGGRPLAKHGRQGSRSQAQWSENWPLVGQPASDRKGKIALSCYKRVDLFMGYKYPLLWAVLAKIFKSKNSYSSSIFQQEFLGSKGFIYICF